MSTLVYQAINAVASDLSEVGLPKRHTNKQGDYQYRSIDDVLDVLAPLLARHKLCVLPRVCDREASSSSGGTAGGVQLVVVRVAFDLVSVLDGSRHTIESFGEAIDESDKGTAKAISSAYKSAMLQAFCIPLPQEDADAKAPRLNSIAHPEPPEGWESWTEEVIHIVESCECAEAIDRLSSGRRQMLASLQRSRSDLYARVGDAIAARLAELQKPKEEQLTQASRKARGRKPQKGTADAACETAEAA